MRRHVLELSSSCCCYCADGRGGRVGQRPDLQLDRLHQRHGLQPDLRLPRRLVQEVRARSAPLAFMHACRLAENSCGKKPGTIQHAIQYYICAHHRTPRRLCSSQAPLQLQGCLDVLYKGKGTGVPACMRGSGLAAFTPHASSRSGCAGWLSPACQGAQWL